VPWRSPNSLRRASTCRGEAPSTSPPSDGYLSHGKAKTHPSWARKGKFAVNGKRSCAELAVAYHLRDNGWHGIWVNSYRRELRSEWFPARAAKTLTDTGAPVWAVEIFDRLRNANGGTLSGFFDVFAWREPGEVRFDEVKVGKDDIKPTQIRFVKLALGLHHHPEQFTIIEVPEQLPLRSARL
jgi:hypothetical protein